MAKDPAFLFYSSDFLTGTILMDDAQIGRYIKLLCLQHSKGRLSKSDFFKIAKPDDVDLISKFLVDKKGFYYNVKLENEVTRRITYCESRRNNRKKDNKHMKNICNSYDVAVSTHMETETETETETITKNENKKRKFIIPTLIEIENYIREKGYTVDANKFFNHYQANGWVQGRNKPIKCWKSAVAYWQSNQGAFSNGKRKGDDTTLEQKLKIIERW